MTHVTSSNHRESPGTAKVNRHRCRRFATLPAALLAVALLGVTHASFADETSQRDGATAADGSESSGPVNQGFSFAALAGFGTDAGIAFDTDRSEVTGASSPDPNPFGPALGLRAAYTFQPGLVTGASLMHHFGGSDSRGRETTSAMFEVGWAFATGPLALEPFVGFGRSWLWATNELCNSMTGECSSSVNSIAATSASVGLMASLPMSERFFIGARVQALGMVGPEFGISGFASGGVRL